MSKSKLYEPGAICIFGTTAANEEAAALYFAMQGKMPKSFEHQTWEDKWFIEMGIEYDLYIELEAEKAMLKVRMQLEISRRKK